MQIMSFIGGIALGHLVDRSGLSRGLLSLWWVLGGMLLIATVTIFDRSLHDVTEALLQILGS